MKKNVILAMSLAVAMGCGSISAYAAETTETTPLTKLENSTQVADKDADKEADKEVKEEEKKEEKKETVPMTKLEEATTEKTETEAAPVETVKVEVSYDKKDLPVVNDVVFVPLRDSADALKLNVAWDAKTRTATLSNDTRSMKLTDGKDLYVSTTTIPGAVGMTKPVELGAAPYVAKDGKMFIPAQAYVSLVGYDVTTTDTQVVIAKKAEVPAEKLVPAEKVEDKKDDASEKTEDKKDDATEKTEVPAEKVEAPAEKA